MMNKKRSRSIGKAKCLIFIPLVSVLMLLSNMEAVARITKKLASDMIMTEESRPEYIPEEAVAQPEEPQEKERKVYTVVDHMPEFPGGEAELLKFVGKNIKYPVSAQKSGIQGRVICSFVVDEKGNIVQPEVVRGVDPDIDAEALRVVGLMPKWTPGKQGGEDVAVKYTVPITFKLSKKSTSEQAPPPPPLPGDPNAIHTLVDHMPQFPGGEKELMNFINTSVKYPVNAQKNKIEGRVICSFVVEKDGTISNATVVRGIDPEIDEESLRVIRQFPKWIPGKIDGKAVRVKYTVPITFRFQ